MLGLRCPLVETWHYIIKHVNILKSGNSSLWVIGIETLILKETGIHSAHP